MLTPTIKAGPVGLTIYACLFVLLALWAFNAHAVTSTTTLAASATTAAVDQSITLTATVKGSSPTGTVTFKDGSTTLGTSTLNAGKATLSTSFATAGSHSVTAVYGGDAKNSSSTSSAVNVTINKATTSTTLALSSTTATVEQTLTLTATVSGSTPSGTVTFKDGSTTLGTSTLNAGKATLSTSFATTGSHSLTAVYAGDANYTTSTSAATAVTVGKAATSTSVSASPSGVGIGQSTTLSASVNSSNATGSVTFQDGTTTLGTAPLNAGSATLATSFTTSGTHSITAVYGGDANYSTSTSAAATVAVNAAPTVAITAPTANSTYLAPASLTVTATATDSDGTISKVEFFNGNTLIGTATSAPYSIAWNNVAAGQYTLTAKATDNSGATTTSAAVAVTVNAAPTIALTSPANNTVANAPATLTLTANATDSDGTIAKVDFFQGSTLIGTATAAPYSMTWSNVAAGSYTLTAKATDNQGAATTSSAVNVIVDAAPTVAMTSPTNNAIIAAPATVTVTASAADSDGTVAKVEFFNGSTSLGTATAAPYSIVWDNVAAGQYSLTAVATDNNGVTTTSSAVNLTIDAAPTVAITAPATNASYTAPAEITLTATANDSDGSISKVEFYNGSTLIGTATTAPYTVTWTNVGAGNYSLTAVATDNHGLSATSAAIALNVNAPPTVNVTAPANNSSYTAPASVTLTANAADSDGSIAKVEFFNGTTLLGTATSAPYSITWDNLAAGNYSITAKATDNQGASTTSTAIAVQVIAAPTVAITAPATNSNYSGPATITLAATAAQADGSVTQVEFFSGATSLGIATAAPYTVTWTNVAAGTYQITARVTNNLGGTAVSDAITVNVIAPPTVSVTAPADNALYAAPATVTLTATATANGTSTIQQVAFYQGSTLIGSTTTAPYSVQWSNVDAGSYSVTAQATDSVGGSTTSTPITVLVVNNTAPTVSVTADAGPATAPATVNFTAAANDSDGSISQVQFFNGTALLGTTTQAPYAYQWTNVAAGTYSITAKATDNLGTATTSAPVTVTIKGPPAQVYFIQADQINTPRIITDANGNTVWQWDSDPFGVTVPNQDPANTGSPFVYNPRFPGQYFDQETGLHYNYFRDYDPATGRYVESDPIGLKGGINTYAYVRGNPLSYFDLFGLQAVVPVPAPAPGPAGGISTPGRGQSGYDPRTDIYTPPSQGFLPNWLRDLVPYSLSGDRNDGGSGDSGGSEDARRECMQKCASDFHAKAAYCEAMYSPEGLTPNPERFRGCAVAAVNEELQCMANCMNGKSCR